MLANSFSEFEISTRTTCENLTVLSFDLDFIFCIFCMISLVSGFLYYGHNPNADSFNVRPYFKDIKHGNLPKVFRSNYVLSADILSIFIHWLVRCRWSLRIISNCRSIRTYWLGCWEPMLFLILTSLLIGRFSSAIWCCATCALWHLNDYYHCDRCMERLFKQSRGFML